MIFHSYASLPEGIFLRCILLMSPHEPSRIAKQRCCSWIMRCCARSSSCSSGSLPAKSRISAMLPGPRPGTGDELVTRGSSNSWISWVCFIIFGWNSASLPVRQPPFLKLVDRHCSLPCFILPSCCAKKNLNQGTSFVQLAVQFLDFGDHSRPSRAQVVQCHVHPSELHHLAPRKGGPTWQLSWGG